MITFEYIQGRRPSVSVSKDGSASRGAWAELQGVFSRGIVSGGSDAFTVRAEVFFAELAQVQHARNYHGARFEYGDSLVERLQLLRDERDARISATNNIEASDPMLLEEELRRAGFERTLKPFQMRNLARLLSLPHGADFSVPGAGKTTVALANFAIHRSRGQVDKLLVIGPIASFEAWIGDSEAAMEPSPKVIVHAGPKTSIPDSTDILLTNYHRVASDYDRIHDYVAGDMTHVILDESHRIKRGAGGVHGRAVLDLAYSSRRRDILTGTPAPQGAGDLIAPVSFLYPGQDRSILPADAYNEASGRDPGVVSATSQSVANYFVRTNKGELGIPDPVWSPVVEPMSPIQQAIYESLVGRYRGSFALPTDDRRSMRKLGRVLMYLLEAAANPALLTAGSSDADPHGFQHPPLDVTGDESITKLLSTYRRFETPWKYRYVRDAVASASSKNEKILVWSTFVRNLTALQRELADFQPAIIHGGVPSENSSARSSAPTRESELRRFREDPKCSVLLANPAAAGEGISLHHWCHHAIYVDRTFNAGQFLQSQDRIHRLGLSPDVDTRFTLLLSRDSIDESVDSRLREKVNVLSTLMRDPGLVRVALPEMDEVDVEEAVEESDAWVLQKHLDGKE